MTNKILILLFFIGISALSLQLKAQPHAHAAMRTHMQAVRTHQQMASQFQNRNIMMSNWMHMKKYQEKYKFTIVTNDGDTISNKKIKVSFLEPFKEIVIKNKKEKITYTPKEVKELYLSKSGRTINGIPYKDYWIFNMHSTPNFKLYSPFPQEEIDYATLYQMNGDTIKEITEDFVKELVAGNAKAEKELKKKKVMKALSIYLKEENKKK